MVQRFVKLTAIWTLGLLALVISDVGANPAADDKVEVSTVMQKSFGKDGYKASITSAVKAGNWDDATKLAKEWADLGAAIGKAKPPKGDPKSWEEQCAKFAANTKAILKGCEAKDAKAVNKAVGSFNCAGCHKAHK